MTEKIKVIPSSVERKDWLLTLWRKRQLVQFKSVLEDNLDYLTPEEKEWLQKIKDDPTGNFNLY